MTETTASTSDQPAPAASPALVLDGRGIAQRLRDEVAARASTFRAEAGRAPGLAVVLVGADPASEVYVAAKGRAAEAAGFHAETHRLPASASLREVLALVAGLNADDAVDGILVQLPLPDGLDAARVIAAIDPDKDVDGLHPLNAGRLASGIAGLRPCTPRGAMRLVREALALLNRPGLAGLEALVIGRSLLFGRPVAQMLLTADATVTIAHSRTRDLPALARRADVLVVAVGRPEMVRGDWVKPGAVVIDVGINRLPAPEKGEGKTRLVGDVAFAEAAAVAGAITPVPGGVGPMTIACLVENTLIAARRRAGLDPEGP